ncbi:hypothetical protein ACOSQ4_031809 [Xanthoceras sorbifolium]
MAESYESEPFFIVKASICFYPRGHQCEGDNGSAVICTDHPDSLIMNEHGDTFVFKSIAMKLDVGDVILTVDCKGKPKAMELDCKFLNGNIVPEIGLMGFLITLVCYCPMVRGLILLLNFDMQMFALNFPWWSAGNFRALDGLFLLDIAEALGIQLALEAVLSPFCCKSDAISIVQQVSSKVSSCSDVGLVVDDIFSLLESLSEYSISWVRRNANLVAHSLAKLALHVVFNCILVKDISSCVASLVWKDIRDCL